MAYYNPLCTHHCRRPKAHDVTVKMYLIKRNYGLVNCLNCIVPSDVGMDKTCNNHAIT
jgi:hypothetical protein